MKVKKNDTVLVLTGKQQGTVSTVIKAFPSENKIQVEGVNIQKRSKKARSAQDTSGIIEQVGKIDASNVLVICPVCGKATRVGYAIVDGKKVRVCKKEGCGASLEVTKETKATKKAKKTAEKKTAKKTTTEKKTTTRKKKADAE